MKWEDIKPSYRAIDYFKIEVGEKVIIRPIGNVFECFEIVHIDGNSFPKHLLFQEEFEDLNFKYGLSPVKKLFINVLDRRDNSVKVLKGGTRLFKAFAQFIQKTKQPFSGMKGADFEVTATERGAVKIYKLKYKKMSELTKEDLDILRKDVYKFAECLHFVNKEELESYMKPKDNL
jgi:hypothetical protein